MGGGSSALERARAAFDAGEWADAATGLAALDAQEPLGPEDLDRLATAAFLIGDDAASDQARTRAHAAFVERGEPVRAARSAFWLGFALLDRPGQRAQAAGWLARAQRLVDEAGEPCVEQGWLLCAAGRQRVAEGDLATANAHFAQAAAFAARFESRDLLALARNGEGRTLLMMGQAPAGLALMDEVMVAVAGGEVAPMVAGAVYCSMISACHAVFDLRRAQEWTAALQAWCAAQPDLLPFRGYCLVRRSELLQLHGSWPDALGEARRACEQLSSAPRRPEAGAAHYQMAELGRLRGQYAEAEEAYRLASQCGCNPQPGLARLRLAQGQAEAAEAAIRVALQEKRDPRTRVLVLAAATEILIARGDVAGARAASAELADLAQAGAPFLRAVAAQAAGAVALAEGQPLPALEPLRAAAAAWQEIGAPYELARVRVLAGLACRQLGDHDGAQLELDAAHEAFERLGAAPDAARVGALATPPAARPASTGLTGRELEVLRLIATGATNRAIAGRLGISEKTVARHVSNIFTKLDLPSRTAAAAFAYEHKLV
jgi:DNA-binding CsgD family transcriptional regulator